MNDDITWNFDLVAIEWLIILAVLVILGVAGTVLIRKFISLKKSNIQTVVTDSRVENYHSQATESVFKLLETNELGLSAEEADIRLKQYGPNKLPKSKPRSSFIRLFNQFHNVLIYVLIVASAITAMLGHWVDASVILGVVVINALIGFVQEGKAENALKAIQKMLSPHAMVMRDGHQITIQAEYLVPGDVVVLQSGDKVAADLRIFQLKGLQIQESALTGESAVVEKGTDPVAQDVVIGDRLCMAFSGTLVTHGQGMGVVVTTGNQTELGNISKLVSEVETETTPLLRKIAEFGRWLTIVILVISVVTFVFGVWIRNYAITDMFLAAVSLAVAAIPEGLPAIMTITLAVGVQRMSRRNAIIRRLPGVETLGSVSVICTDKTGTLTRNEMIVKNICTGRYLFEFDGRGYEPHGKITLESEEIQIKDNPALIETLRAGLLCNNSSLEKKDDSWLVNGDPMEGALLVAAIKGGLNTDNETSSLPRIDIIPFEAEHRFMATLHQSQNADSLIYLKGAPEQVLEMCSSQRININFVHGDNSNSADNSADNNTDNKEPIDKQYWLSRIEEMAMQGQRVLAVATKSVSPNHNELIIDDTKEELTLLGMLGFIDPPRLEVVKAVKDSANAGIRVMMITGDHGATAKAIAKQIKLINTDEVLTGQELDLMSEKELSQRISEVDVYARVNPEHKLSLVKILQEQDQIVAMTGDGVNDAPALKKANIGIAMGRNGTEAAKEAAEMVLADDNFSTIISAIKEGRTVYDNLQKSILFILPNSGGEALIIFAAVLFGFHQLPLTPVQILWINMVTTVALDLTLAVEPPERNVMHRQPRGVHEPILNRYLVWRIIFVSLIMMSGTILLFLWEMKQGVSIEYARTVAINTLVMFEIFYLFNTRYIHASVFNWAGLTGNRLMLIAVALLILIQLGFTYTAPMQSLFGTAAINMNSWMNILLVSCSVLFLVEFEKLVVRKIWMKKSGVADAI